MSPLTGDHDVVVRLVPEVESKRRLVLLGGWPGARRFERLREGPINSTPKFTGLVHLVDGGVP